MVAVLAHLGEWSGAPAAAVRFACLLEETQEFRVVMIVPSEGEAARRARDAGLDVLVVCQPEVGLSSGSRLIRLCRKVSGTLRLARVLRRERAEVAWIHGMVNLWLGCAAWLAGCRILWHGHELFPPGGARAVAIRRWVVGRLARVVVYAGESARRQWLRSITCQRARDAGVLPNPLASKLWSRLARHDPQRPAAPRAGKPVVVLASGLYIRKAPDRLLRAVAAWGRPARVILIGEAREGPEEQAFLQELEVQIEVLPPGVTVERPGPVADVVPLLDQAHLFVSLSRSEVAPLLLVEAMACGVPVVVSDTGEQAAMVGYGNHGWVVHDPGDPPGVAAVLQEVMDDPLGETALKCQRARAWALGIHDPQGVRDQAARLIRDVLKG